jgi:hypothetical protein
MKKYKEKIKQMQQHYGDPQYELDDEEWKKIKEAQENNEVMSEMAEDDKRAEDAL